MPSVEAGDIQIYYEIHGEGEPLLLIMGLGTDIQAWIFQIRDFSEEYRTITFDNRDAGRTGVSRKTYTIRTLADDTLALMDALIVDRAHVLGVSMGGYIAQEFAFAHPERVRSLILANTAARPGHRGTLIMDTWARMRTEGIDGELFERQSLPWIFTDATLDDPGKVSAIVRARLENPYIQQADGYRRQVDAARSFDASGRLGAISAPTLVLAGRDDLLVPLWFAEELTERIPNAELVVLPGGHGLFNEFPAEFNRAVLKFLRGLKEGAVGG
ncbi:MAG: alpha/beta fold hydrolase [bacterium]|nr:MAG: alpha/beta fold hydrolase [bacterium]